MGRHVLKVEPLNAILDPQYFVRAVHGCVLAVLRARSEHGQRQAEENPRYRHAPATPRILHYIKNFHDGCAPLGHDGQSEHLVTAVAVKPTLCSE